MQHIGLISDTHGLLRPQALAFLENCDQIIHAGDIGKPEILHSLQLLAPLTAVRGNHDHQPWAAHLKEREILQVEKVRICIIHDVKQLDGQLAQLGVQVVIAGHSHRPYHAQRDGVLVINPGSAGPRRFKLPVSVGRLVIDGNQITPLLHELVLT